MSIKLYRKFTGIAYSSLSVILQPRLRRVTAFVTVPRSVTAFVTVAGEASDGKECTGVRIQRNKTENSEHELFVRKHPIRTRLIYTEREKNTSQKKSSNVFQTWKQFQQL